MDLLDAYIENLRTTAVLLQHFKDITIKHKCKDSSCGQPEERSTPGGEQQDRINKLISACCDSSKQRDTSGHSDHHSLLNSDDCDKKKYILDRLIKLSKEPDTVKECKKNYTEKNEDVIDEEFALYDPDTYTADNDRLFEHMRIARERRYADDKNNTTTCQKNNIKQDNTTTTNDTKQDVLSPLDVKGDSDIHTNNIVVDMQPTDDSKYPLITPLSKYSTLEQNKILRNIFESASKFISDIHPDCDKDSDEFRKMVQEEADKRLSAWMDTH